MWKKFKILCYVGGQPTFSTIGQKTIILGLGASVLQLVHTFGAWKVPQTTE